jgi:hypothetical protein
VAFNFRFKTRDEVKNFPLGEAPGQLEKWLGPVFRNADLFSTGCDATLFFDKKGNAVFSQKKPSHTAPADTRHDREKQRLLDAIGAKSFEDLVQNIPQSGRHRPAADGFLKDGISEMEVLEHLKALAAKNQTVEHAPSFLGAGAYNHFIPSAIGALITRGEFLTAYTPYPPAMNTISEPFTAS